MKTQYNRDIVMPMNPIVGMVETSVRYFTRLKLEFHGSMVEEDPQEFIDEIYKVLMIIKVTLVKKGRIGYLQT